MDKNTQRVKRGCYLANLTMSVVANLSPLLFLTFHNVYGISFSLLGALVLVNFCTQMLMDFVFSFFSHRFNIGKTVKIAPLLSIAGLVVYALAPFLFKDAIYIGLALGTVIFSASSGLNEVLTTPVVTALPSDNPERDLSMLHSIYAWGVVAVITLITLFLVAFGVEYWFVLPLAFCAVPLASFLMLVGAKVPELETPKKVAGAVGLLKNKSLLLCVFSIFLGGAVELTMAQWGSSYLEQALGIKKVWGDIFGTAVFAMMMGIGRTLYAKKGKNIEKILLLSGISAAVCYLVCILSPLPVIGLIACGLTGLCVAMMWPGSLVVVEKRVPTGGVFLYAMMACGGDLGASLAPQLMGVVTDGVTASAGGASLAARLGISLEQLAMKAGMCVGFIFALLSAFVYFYVWKTRNRDGLSEPLTKQ